MGKGIYMEKQISYEIQNETEYSFKNHADFCVGTGRMGLTLQQQYQEQLKLVQEQIGFRHIRGHGIFCDDMAIYQEYTDESGNIRAEYNFTYLDMVMDAYQNLGIKPFLELGFMPQKMASGDQTVFYWKGNVTPPKSYEAWSDLVQAVLLHLFDRYGKEEVVTWPVEVWNEPNLPGFWKGADKEEYFTLFQKTYCAVKKTDSRFLVGGPAICGVDDVLWLRQFLEFCREQELKPDFITRHHYMWEKPEQCGHYSYGSLKDPKTAMEELKVSREIIDSFESFHGLPMHITEFNTSYSPDSPIHDTTVNAAYVAWLLSKMGDLCESYSYWTFGDIFEEKGVPFTPFYGGFGLVANGTIPKPTFWTFAFFKKLQGKCIHRSDELIVMEKEDGSYCAAAWNLCLGQMECLRLSFTLPVNEDGEYCLLTKTVDEAHGNPRKIWHDMGEPSWLSNEETQILKDSAQPLIHTESVSASANVISISISLQPWAVMWFQLKKIKRNGDRGYDYCRGESPAAGAKNQ